MKMVLLFGAQVLFIVIGFGFLLKTEYGWIKRSEESENVIKRIALWFMTIATAVIGLCAVTLFGIYLLFSVFMYIDAMEHAKIVNLNSNTTVLSVNDTWNVDDLGNVSVNYITELSAEEAQDKYKITPKETERYFELSFTYENIGFEGYLLDGKVVEDIMQMGVYVSSEDINGDAVEAWLDTRGESNFYYADQGTVKKDNKFLMIADRLANLHAIEVTFTIYTPDKYGIYRQDFLYKV